MNDIVCIRCKTSRSPNWGIDNTGLTICAKCLSSELHSSVEAHGEIFPECPTKWHDLWDHFMTYASSAAVRKLVSHG